MGLTKTTAIAFLLFAFHVSDALAVPPNGVIDAPPGGSVILVGESVSFSGTGSDPDSNFPLTYLWDFDETNSGVAPSALEDPGAVVFNTAGSFTVSLTVTDAEPLADPTPATVEILVSPQPVVVDNTDPGFATTGSWSSGTAPLGYYGSDFLSSASSNGSETATWTFSISEAGRYGVSAYWIDHGANAIDAPHTIYNNGAPLDTIRVSQRVDGSTFNLLGIYDLVPGTLEVVLTSDASRAVIADAVELSQSAFGIVHPRNAELLSERDVHVTADAVALPAQWGVEFVVDGDEVGAVQDLSPPFERLVSGVGDYTVDAHVIDANGTRIETSSIQFAIGDYFVAFGDSITKGVGDDYPADNTSSDGRNNSRGYSPILNDLLTAYRGYPHNVSQEGAGGEESFEGLARVGAVLAKHPNAQTLLILYGTNDVFWTGRPSGVGLSSGDPGYADSYKDYMHQIVDAVLADGKQAHLVTPPILLGGLSGPYADPASEPVNLLIQEYRDVLDELSLELGLPTPVPDLYAYFELNPSQLPDTVHPNGTGSQSLAGLMFNAMTGAVCGNGVPEGSEQCDDGNTDSGDCCSSTCQYEVAGSSCDDSTVCNGLETCDGAGSCDAGTPLTCDDGAFCNGAESCDAGLGCQAGTPPVIDDGVVCTDDSCDEVGDLVVNAVNHGNCDDADVCNGAETCDAALDCQAGTPLTCDDGAFCNGAESCDAGLGCQAGTPPVIDDGVVCTDDSCDEIGDLVVNAVNHGNCDDADVCNGAETCDAALDCQAGTPLVCDDGAFCNGAESCDAGLGCQAGTPPVIDDGVVCTDDSCDEVGDLVVNAVNNGNCDDADVCNGAETCDAALDCQAGTPLVCDDGAFCNGAESCDAGFGCQAGTPPVIDDGVVCTDDSCDEVGDLVVNAVNHGNCDDADVCNGAETCDAALDCQAGTPLTCDDGAFCNGAESCDAGLGCQAGTPPVIDDGVVCTDDSCDEVGDLVVNAVNNGNCDDADVCNGAETCDAALDCQAGTPLTCDDGAFCNGAESCDAGLGCQAGTPPVIDDGVVCTDDSCDEIGDLVVNAVNHGNCDDADVCNGAETCDAALDCQAGTPLVCDDGAFCNGAESCDAGLGCQAGTPPVIDDGVVCTDDSCDEVGDLVVNAVNNGNCDDADVCNGAETCDAALDCQAGTPLVCDDGAFCNGAESCDAGFGCQAGTPPVIDDGVVCTDDSCDEVGDLVVNAVNNGNCDDADVCNGAETCDAALDCQAGTPLVCDDGAFCNGAESCDAGLGCQAGTPPVIDDGVVCTDDSCDEVGDLVVNAVNHGNCDDADVCNGAETCDAALDCQAGTPLVCDDGAFCNGAESCDAGLGCQAGTPPVIDDGVVCTDDSCDEVGDLVVNAVNNGNCDDADVCNGAETCDAALDCQAGTPLVCDDGAFCNGAESCDAGLGCQAGTPPVIDDGVVCTDDSCDEVGDLVVNAVNNGNCDDADVCNGAETCDAALDCQAGTPLVCDDGAFCNGAESCDAGFGCQAGTPPVIDDGVVCTDDSCDEVGDLVVNAVNHGNCDDADVCNGAETCDAALDCQAGTPLTCDDGAFCNGAESCDAGLGCQAGTPPVIDDGVVCTDDSCDEVGDLVVNAVNNGNCDDADVCNGAETCDAALDCQAGTPLVCDDGAFCNGAESCDAGLGCQAGTPPVIDDGVVCTDDSCDEVGDLVVNAVNHGNCDDADVCNGAETCDAALDCQAGTPLVCDDGAFCNGSESCDAGLGCQAGTPPVIDDGVVCTDDSCDEVGDLVVNAVNNGNCDDADVCNGAETCDAALDCQAGTPLVCDDGAFCNGSESCDAGLGCQAGTPPAIDDGVVCTDDSCDEVGDLVVNAVNHGNCDDADVCNGAETCDAALDCQAGTPLTCDDGAFCNGAESCDAGLGCQAGTPPVIDDGVVCTDDSCDEVGDAVVNAPDDLACDDADPCTADSCDQISGCGNAPIALCGSGVPATPGWGLWLLAGLLLAAGALLVRERRRTAA